MPRLALRLHGGLPARACVEQARAAEDAGFDTVWFAENPFGRGVLPAMTACALATTRIRLGVGVFNPFNRHPTLMAMEAAALDELAGGRVVLGIGAGIKIDQMGLSRSRPIAAVRDAIHIARGLLRGDEVTYRGALFSADRVRLEFGPLRPDIPIFMAAVGDQAMALCGEIADGLMISNMSPPAFSRRAVALVDTSAALAGRRERPPVVQYVPCVIRDDPAGARGLAKQAVGAMLRAYWRDGHASPATQSALRDYCGRAPEEFVACVTRLANGEPGERVLDDALVDEYAIAGTAAECRERLSVYGQAGVTELAVWFPGASAVADVARLARELGR